MESITQNHKNKNIRRWIKSIHQKIRPWHIAYPVPPLLTGAGLIIGLVCALCVAFAVFPVSRDKNPKVQGMKEIGALVITAHICFSIISRFSRISDDVENWVNRQKETEYLSSSATLQEKDFCKKVIQKIEEQQGCINDVTEFSKSFLDHPYMAENHWHEPLIVQRLTLIATAQDTIPAEILCRTVFKTLRAFHSGLLLKSEEI